jgi:periplasmic protein TonB
MHATLTTADLMLRSQTPSSTGRSSLWLVVLGVVVASAAGIAVFLSRSNEAPVAQPTVQAPSAPPVVAPLPAAAGKNSAQLLELARGAMREQRLVEPAGNNAYELYLAVLAQEPGNRVAQDALRETFPFAAAAVDRAIEEGDFARAQREIDLLGRADESNYTLVLLRARLATQLKLAGQAKQTPPPPVRQPQAVASAHAPVPAPTSLAPRPVATVPEPVAVAQLPTAPSPLARATSEPVLRHSMQPNYPAEAKRTRRQGWVDVQFIVETSGKVSHAVVMDAEPKFLFDRAAVAAVERWEFAPATNGDQAVPATLRQRIQFKL